VDSRRLARVRRRAGIVVLIAGLLAAALALPGQVCAGQGSPLAGELFARALGNDDVSYTATRTSLFWSDNGQTRALVAYVSKDGGRTRYEYPARGNRPATVVIETPEAVCFVVSDGGRTRVTTAHRQNDNELDAARVKLALSNYQWRFEPSPNPRRRIISAWRSGAAHASQRFWIQSDAMIIVRSERYGPKGELRASWSLDTLHTVADLPDKLFTAPHGPDLEVREASLPEIVHLEEVQSKVGFEPVRLPDEKLPEGYRLVNIAIEQTAGKAPRKAVRFVYSDGLDSFSLLETPRLSSATEKLKGENARDVSILDTDAQLFTSAEANLVHWQDRKRRYTLMGSLPPNVLMALSRTVMASGSEQRLRPIVSTPVSGIAPPPRRGLGELVARGWSRLMRIFGH